MRSYIRHPSDIPIEYRTESEGSSMSQERLNDVSRGGLSFSSLAELPVGTLITIRISHVKPGFEARARVAWCRHEGGGFVIGVSFVESGDLFKLRMVEQICHIEHYKTEVLATQGRKLNGEQAAQEWIQKFAETFPELEDEEQS